MPLVDHRAGIELLVCRPAQRQIIHIRAIAHQQGARPVLDAGRPVDTPVRRELAGDPQRAAAQRQLAADDRLDARDGEGAIRDGEALATDQVA
jgi:hypothetical protein